MAGDVVLGGFSSPAERKVERGAGPTCRPDRAFGTARRPGGQKGGRGWTAGAPLLSVSLSSVPHTQVLVWDKDLIQPMSLIADASFVRKGGITKMVRLPVPNLTEQYPDAQEYIFLVRPSLSIVEMVVDAIR